MSGQAETRPQLICDICHRNVSNRDGVPLELVHRPVAELIQRKHPQATAGSFICFEDLNHFRSDYIEDVMEREKGELSALETEVVRSFREQELVAANINAQFDRQATTGEWVADRVAEFGGSWAFIICFMAVMVVWILCNTVMLISRPFDPYPFILLNLVLSCLAALQAPVIMMSQNRQEAKDRLRAEHDYRVNLKAELEIRHLNAKIDMLLTHQWQQLLEIQRVQADLIQDAVRKTNPSD